jgi:alpha-1,6-mannosyltransferase
MSRPATGLVALGLLWAALMLGDLRLFWPVEVAIPPVLRTDLFVGTLFVGALVYFAAVRLVLRHDWPLWSLWFVLAVATVVRVAVLQAWPVLSTDVFRYIWDGRVQAAGINPYRYVPADPALAGLRDSVVFPFINRPDYARTIYPPAAQLTFAALGQITHSVAGMKIAAVGFEAFAALCMMQVLAGLGLPRQRIVIYAWNPLPVWAFACDGHVDAAAIALLALALLLRSGRRDGSAGAALAAAALVKFLPVVTAPAFARGGRPWRAALAGSAVILSLYLVYSTAGVHVLGYLPHYGTEEGLNDGRGFWLLAGVSHLVTLPSVAGFGYILVAVACYIALSASIIRQQAATAADDVVMLCRDAGLLAAFATAAISPHYAWYFAWLALPCVVAPTPVVVWLSAASVLLYTDPFDDRFFWPCLVYLPAFGLVVRRGWLRAWTHPVSVAAEAASWRGI